MMLQMFEPSSCQCGACRSTCETLPGHCAPGDIERIAAHIGMVGDAVFLQEQFQPTAGPTVNYWGEDVNIPVIRPMLRDGRCVFLTPDNRCGICAVRPFGCATGNACEGGNPDAEEACLRAIAEDMEYLDLWTELVYDDVAS